MPTEPSIEVMDAGVRDNLGLHTSINYIDKFKHWIGDNTSGIIIVQIRDKEKNRKKLKIKVLDLYCQNFLPL